jgi:hypothetical protein
MQYIVAMAHERRQNGTVHAGRRPGNFKSLAGDNSILKFDV